MRIGIVNDMAMAVEVLRRTVVSVPEFEVAWIARDGQQAVALAAEDTPDLILMDLFMPVMGGLEAIRRIMQATPCAILVVTATVDANASHVFEALGAGAIDAVNTPVMTDPKLGPDHNPLLAKLRVIQRLIGKLELNATPPKGVFAARTSYPQKGAGKLILMGSSAGGPPALAEILTQVPRDSPPVVIVQHIDGEFAPGMAEWLQHKTCATVRVAREGDVVAHGTVYLAGTSNHLVFTGPETLGYSEEPLDSIYHPCIDVCFLSAVTHVRGRLAAAILTGMGRDGALGLKALRNSGAFTITQDRQTSVVYGMPKAAAELDAADKIMPLSEIVPAMLTYLAKGSRDV